MSVNSNTAAASPDVSGAAISLKTSLQAVLDAIPGTPHSPTHLAHQLGLSRVTMSKLLSALARGTPYDVVERIPGPDSLRGAVESAAELGVDPLLISAANQAIDSFENLIRDHFGTRAALHASIVAGSHALRTRVNQAARADVFKGLRQVLGVEADTWMTSMFFVPSPTDPESVSVTTIHGALGLRRLRPDTEVYFTFGPPYHSPENPPDYSRSPISLQEFYTHEPAPLETGVIGGQLRHKLVDDRLGKHALADMLAVSHAARGSRMYAAPDSALRGVSLFVDTPSRVLLCDAIVHKDVFPDSEPELIVYNPGARGPANPNDRSRDIDRVAVSESVAHVSATPQRFEVPEVPHYSAMVKTVCAKIGCAPEDFRVYRLRMAYPVPSFQITIAFQAPAKPEP